ncbi:MAG: hypothetical protein PHY23_06895 [Oscillospiraceae bacterium]|nr:hypothetical protein [Oscillospiraceae bacterium]
MGRGINVPGESMLLLCSLSGGLHGERSLCRYVGQRTSISAIKEKLFLAYDWWQKG